VSAYPGSAELSAQALHRKDCLLLLNIGHRRRLINIDIFSFRIFDFQLM